MKQLQKSDLKEGEICKQLNFNYIFLYNKNETFDNFNDGTAISTTDPRYCKIWSANGFEKDMIEATLEEKHWLETCIKADQFVSYENAMKTFIPEYVECIRPIYWLKTIKENNGNLIFKSDFISSQFVQIIEVLPQSTSFKPSTKEAYDAQFVVKEPEFVLPEKWYVKDISKNEIDIVCEYGNKMWSTPNYNCKTWKPTMLGKILIGNYSSGRPYFVNNDFSHNHTEITFDQFKQYVLKENTTVTEEPKVVLEEPKDKVLTKSLENQIIQVESSEGGVFQIGDKITPFDKYSPNKGKPFTIKSFRWSNDKSKICAVTELHTPNGIGLDKIELYVEPKVKELSLLEQAKLKYPIGIKFKSVTSGKIFTIKNHNFEKANDPNTIVFQTNELNQNGNSYACVHYKNQWAEIVDDFVLPENWCIRLNLENVDIVGKWFNENSQTHINDYNSMRIDKSATLYNILHFPMFNYHGSSKHGDINNQIQNDYTEITFEQFKKYVLKDE